MTDRKNGNGKAPKITAVKVTDSTHIAVLCIFVIQSLGRATTSKIKETLVAHCHADVNRATLASQLKALKARQLIVELQEQDENGTVVDVWKLRNMDWRTPLEYAHVNDLIPKILETDEGKALVEALNASENTGIKKARNGNFIGEYRSFAVLCYQMDYLLGSQMHCPLTDEARRHCGIQIPMDYRSKPKKDEKTDDLQTGAMNMVFVLDPLTGEYLIPSDVLNGWFITSGVRYSGLPKAAASYIEFQPIRIKPRRVIQAVLPVQSDKGKGATKPQSYECIEPGHMFWIHFSVPTKGMLTSDQWEKLFFFAGAKPRRGISPARGRRYGRFLVVEWRDLGLVAEAGFRLDLTTLGLPDRLLKKAGLKPKYPIPDEPTEEQMLWVASEQERLVPVPLGGKHVTLDAEDIAIDSGPLSKDLDDAMGDGVMPTGDDY